MAVPNIFANVTTSIPLSQLDANFATAITLGNTAVYLGNTTTTIGNLTLTNANVSSVSTPITPAQGGTGLSTLTANNVLIGNGTSNVTFVAPGTSGNVLTSNGTVWSSSAAPTGSAATPTALGTVYGKSDSATPFNTALGYQAANSITTDDSVTAIGYKALSSNTTGSGSSGNTAVGREALNANTTGYYATAVGYRALYNSNVGYVTAVGFQALQSLTSSSGSTAFGYRAGYSISSGSGNNTCVGYNAGNNITTGAYNTFVGADSTGAAATDSSEIVVGNNSTGKGSNTAFINPNGGGVYAGNNSANFSTTSDQRLKKNIVDNNEGLNKITAIRIRNFEYRLPEEVTELEAHCAIDKTGVQLGVIAQELQQVCPDCVKEESTGVLSVNQENITWHMINAIKDLKALVDAQATEIAELKAKVGA